MFCECIENHYGNTNFTVGERYEVKVGTPHIRTNWADMWTSHFENISPSDTGEFEVGMCKFRLIV